MGEPREFWVGISDTNVAHINDKQMWASDYCLVKKSDYDAVVNERDEWRGKYDNEHASCVILSQNKIDLSAQLAEAQGAIKSAEVIIRGFYKVSGLRIGQLAEAKALIEKGVKFESFCIVRINRLERALTYAKRVLQEWSMTQSRELERLERGE